MHTRRTLARLATMMPAAGLALIATVPAAADSVAITDSIAGGNGFSLVGSNDGSRFARAGADAGDVNGDGLGDFIFGEPREGSGRAYVLFGRSTPLSQSEFDLLVSGSSTIGFLIGGDGLPVSSQVGFAVCAVGDFNGDLLGDVAIGAPTLDEPGLLNLGRVYVVFGKSTGSTIQFTDLDSPTSGLGFAIRGKAGGDLLGFSVSGAGDFNGDGIDDLIAGAVDESRDGIPIAGAAYVVFGKSSSSPVSVSDLVSGTSSSGIALRSRPQDGRAGRSVAGAGDVNGDGFQDVVVGAYRYNPGGLVFGGRAFVVFGRTGTAAIELSDVANSSLGLGLAITGEVPYLRLGTSVSSVHDMNNDGLADIIVGSDGNTPAVDGNGIPILPLQGRAHVVFGRTSSQQVFASAITAGTDVAGFAIFGESEKDFLGLDVAGLGDLDSDGRSDVLVGAPGADLTGLNELGKAAFVFGRSGPPSVDLTELATLASPNGSVFLGDAIDQEVGRSVAGLGDFNGDGLADMAICAGYAPVGGADETGIAYVLFNTRTPATASSYKAHVRAGDARRWGVGSPAFTVGVVSLPASRAWVDFDAGMGPGLGGSSEVSVTITRNDAGLTGVNPTRAANVQWQVDSNRSAWDACRVTVRYTNAEIAGLAESALKLYWAPSVAGPFAPVASPVMTPGRNEASGVVASLPAVFALVVPNNGDANADLSVDVADLTAIYNQLAGIATLPPEGDGDVDNDGDVDVVDAGLLRDHLVDGTALP